MARVLVIGNGFDLDLGLKTRYSDYACSSNWPFERLVTPLARFLSEKAETESWLDIESALAEFGTKHLGVDDKRTAERDFQYLNESFTNYILGVEKGPIKGESAAVRLLEAIIEGNGDTQILSFNFTNLAYIVRYQLFVEEPVNYLHVHGCAQKKNAILGVGDYANLNSTTDFLYKSFNRNYNPPHIIDTLLAADEVILFGLSMGRADFQYFEDYFKVLASYEPDSKRKLTIITYDDASRIEILRNIQTMTDHNLGRIRTLNDFKILCTGENADCWTINQLIADIKSQISQI